MWWYRCISIFNPNAAGENQLRAEPPNGTTKGEHATPLRLAHALCPRSRPNNHTASYVHPGTSCELWVAWCKPSRVPFVPRNPAALLPSIESRCARALPCPALPCLRRPIDPWVTEASEGAKPPSYGCRTAVRQRHAAVRLISSHRCPTRRDPPPCRPLTRR